MPFLFQILTFQPEANSLELKSPGDIQRDHWNNTNVWFCRTHTPLLTNGKLVERAQSCNRRTTSWKMNSFALSTCGKITNWGPCILTSWLQMVFFTELCSKYHVQMWVLSYPCCYCWSCGSDGCTQVIFKWLDLVLRAVQLWQRGAQYSLYIPLGINMWGVNQPLVHAATRILVACSQLRYPRVAQSFLWSISTGRNFTPYFLWSLENTNVHSLHQLPARSSFRPKALQKTTEEWVFFVCFSSLRLSLPLPLADVLQHRSPSWHTVPSFQAKRDDTKHPLACLSWAGVQAARWHSEKMLRGASSTWCPWREEQIWQLMDSWWLLFPKGISSRQTVKQQVRNAALSMAYMTTDLGNWVYDQDVILQTNLWIIFWGFLLKLHYLVTYARFVHPEHFWLHVCLFHSCVTKPSSTVFKQIQNSGRRCNKKGSTKRTIHVLRI